MPGKGGLQLTGKLGEVIRESAQIGLSWVKSHAYDLGITPSEDEQFLTDRDIHVHMPEGSVGKEGPSAGTAIVSAFVSLFTKTRVNPDIGTFFSFILLFFKEICHHFLYSNDGRNISCRTSVTSRWIKRKDIGCSSSWYQNYLGTSW
jgi:hypothetical protein